MKKINETTRIKRTGLYSALICFFLLLLCASGKGREAEVKAGAKHPHPSLSPLPRLHAGNDYIYDQLGRVVLLRGTNVSAYLYDPFAFSEPDAEAIASFGFNFIRLAVSWSKAEPEKGEYNLAYLTALKDFIRSAGARGIYVMPDIHQVSWCAPGSNVPAWMCQDLPARDSDILGTSREAARFWEDPALQAELIDFWKFLIGRFQGLDNVIGYNALNEPFTLDCLVPGRFEKKLFPFYDRWISAFRESDPAGIAVVEPCGSDLVIPGRPFPLQNQNVVFAPHPYFWHGYDDRGNLFVIERETPRQLRKKYRRLVRDARRMDVPLLIGEFGCPEGYEFARAWLLESLRLQDQYFLGSAVWTYDPRDFNWSIVDEGRGPRAFKWSVLHRPYPRYTAGVPQRLYFSLEEREFAFDYQPGTEIDAPTEIYFPREFMDTASITVGGGAWSYDDPGQVLMIENDKGAEKVEVAIKF